MNKALLPALLAIGAISCVQAQVVYRQGFTNTSGSNKLYSEYEWYQNSTNSSGGNFVIYDGPQVLILDGKTTAPNVNAVAPYGDNNALGLIFVSPQQGNNAGRTVSWTNDPDIQVNVSALVSVSMDVGVNTNIAGNGFRIAVQIANQWYVTSTLHQPSQTTGATFDSTAQSYTFNWTNSAASWRTISFVEGTSLTPTLGTVGSDLSGTVQSIGLFVETTGNFGAHVDNFTVTVGAAPVPGSLQLGSAVYSGGYDSGGITVTVERTGGSAGAVSVNYATSDGTALAGTDYAATSGTLSWDGGVSGSQTVFIPLLNNPGSEGKGFSFALSGQTGGATLGSPASATITITGSVVGLRPNIVLFFVDDMGINDVGAYTYPQVNPYPASGPAPIAYAAEFDPLPPPNVANGLTPRIDSLATHGLKFSSFYAAVSVCTPSRAGLMTGCYATRVDMEEVIFQDSQTHGLNPSEVTIAERLKQAGYTTGIIGKWHLGLFGGSKGMDFNPRRHGFDMFLGTNSGTVNTTDLYDGESIAGTITTATGGTITSPIDTVAEKRYLLEAQTERSMAFIEQANANGQPFFLYFSTIAPHTPCWPHPDFVNASSVSQYYDVVAELDHRVGQILDKLSALGIAGNTLVIFTSDNGPWVSRYESNPALRLDPENTVGSAYPYRGYKRGANEGGPRVPFLARYPGRIPAGLVVDGIGSSIDLLPTLLGLAGGEVPSDRPIDGVDLWPLMNGTTTTSPRSTFFYYEENDTSAVGVRSGDSKLLSSSDYGAATGLFNLASDIQESTNLGSSGTLSNLISSHNSAMSRRTRATSKSTSIELDTDTLVVSEGGTATFNVRLSAAANLTVTISRFSGDADLGVQSGASLVFTTGNYNVWQTVTLAAATDPDSLSTGATFRATASGLNVREIFALEADSTTPPLTAAESWRQFWFGQTANSGIAADGFDFEQDGLVNLLERAFGTDPTTGETVATRASGAPPVLSMVDAGGNPGDDYLAMTYRRLAGGTGTTGSGYSVDGLSYFVELDSDMVDPWTAGGVTVLSVQNDTPQAGIQTVTVRSNTALSTGSPQFLRLRIEAQ